VTVDAIAIRFQLLPDVIDLSFVVTFSGIGGLLMALVGALAGFPPDRLARLVVFGNLIGAAVGTIVLLVGVVS
jgi:hypothetical protein